MIIVINVIPRVLSGEEGAAKASKGWEQCKRGYLRIKQKGFPKARWPLLVRYVNVFLPLSFKWPQ